MLKVLKLCLIFSLFLNNSIVAKELDKVSMQLQWLDQFQFAGYYIAKEKGFYKDVGLDVDIKKFNYEICPVDEVVSKKATYGVGRSSLIIDRSDGKKISLLSATFQSSPFILLAREDSGIKTIKDFVGKRIMSTPELNNMASVNAMINKFGVTKDDMVTLPHTFNIEDLIDKKTDLMASYISNEPFVLKQRGIKSTIFEPKDYGFDFYSDILFTSSYEMEHHHKRAINFRDASIKGWEYAFTHIDETVNLILKKYNSQRKSKEALIYEANELKKLAYYKTKKLGKIDKNKIQRIYDIYNVMGLVKNKIDLDDFISTKATNKIHLTKEEKHYLEKKKEILMCIDPNWMPFEKLDKNKHIGLSADYFEIFQKNLQIPINVVPTNNWNESLEYAKIRKCDILSLAMSTPKRKKYMNFTEPYLKVPVVLATKNDVPFIANFGTLRTQKIGIPRGYAFVEILKKRYPNLNIIEVDNIKDGLNKVREGELFGYIGTLASVGYHIQKEFTGELKIAGKFDEYWELGIAVRNDDKILLEIFQKAISSISEDTNQKILNKWIAIKYEKSIDYTLIWKVASILIIILLIVIYFLIKQSRLKNNIKDLNLSLEKRIKDEVEKNRQKDQQMQQQSKLAQMGEMISMIAHQWRQPLNAISLTSSNLKFKCIMDQYDKDLFEKEIDLIDEYTQHLSKTIDDFRGFFKEDKKLEETSLNDIVNSTLDIVKISAENKGITINTDLQCNKMIETYPNEIKQVVLNLIKNAEDALKEVTLGNVLLEKEIENPTITIQTTSDTNKENKIIIIKDNAGGIPEDIKDKIFEPYFSTKLEKDGTGLGLYMSKTIVEEHCGGKLSVSNDEDGAVFKIEFNGDIDEK